MKNSSLMNGSRKLMATAAMAMVSLLAPSAWGAQVAKPNLFVSILVEGLDGSVVDMLKDNMSADGFKKFINNGLTVKSVDYPRKADATAATAILMTGASPSVSGISGSLSYDPATGKAVPMLHDADVLGNFTKETFSPRAIAVNTLADELRIDGAGRAPVRTLAANPAEAIIMAGHAGNSAFWIDDTSGKWATTTFYKDVPQPISSRNYKASLTSRLDTMRWEPGATTLSLNLLPPSKKKYPFLYTFTAKQPQSIDAYKTSPLANRDITDIALDYIASAEAEDGAVEMIGLVYNLSPYPYTRTSDGRQELYDAYLKLDADLARLNAALSRNVAGRNAVVMVAGLPPTTTYRRDEEHWRTPHGVFSPKKAQSILNMYLMALHGNGEWVKGYHDKQFYLNSELIESKQLSVVQLRSEAAEFLAKMSGISKVQTLQAVLTADAAGEVVASNAGDIFIEVIPGWEIEDANSAHPLRNPSVERTARVTSPVYILAPSISPSQINVPVDARRIAPTVARILRIRSPGGASEPPLL